MSNLIPILRFLSSSEKAQKYFQIDFSRPASYTDSKSIEIGLKSAIKKLKANSKSSGKFGSFSSKKKSFDVSVSIVQETPTGDEMTIDLVLPSFKDAMSDKQSRVLFNTNM